MDINIPIEAMPEKRMQLDAVKEAAQSKKKAKTEGADFKEDLKTAMDNRVRKILDDLISLIDEQGKILVQAPIYENLLKYKDLVGTFMKEVMKNTYQIKEVVTGKGIARQLGQKRVYLTIQEVNKELAALTEEVLKAQANPIAIAARLETLQGLLLDIYS